MRPFLVVVLILTALLLACTSEPALPPRVGNDAAPQAPVTTELATQPPTEMPTAAAPPPQPAPTDLPEPTATATTKPNPTTEPAPAATPMLPPATAALIATSTIVAPTPTSWPARPTATAVIPTTVLRITVSTIPSNLPTYDRHDWKHWTDADGDCQDARQEVLVAESRSAPGFRSDRKCRVKSGEWLSPYSNTVVTDPGKLDIDHMVPLGNAHASGA